MVGCKPGARLISDNKMEMVGDSVLPTAWLRYLLQRESGNEYVGDRESGAACSM